MELGQRFFDVAKVTRRASLANFELHVIQGIEQARLLAF